MFAVWFYSNFNSSAQAQWKPFSNKSMTYFIISCQRVAAVPAVPDVSEIPEPEATPSMAEEPPMDNSVQPDPVLEDETPRKKQRVSNAKDSSTAQQQAEDVDSADDNEAPTLEEQVRALGLLAFQRFP